MRRQATEKLSETKKRKASLEDTDADDNISPGKRKKSTSMVDVVQQTIELKKWQQEHDEEIKKRESCRDATTTNVPTNSFAATTPIPTTTTGTEHVYDICYY